jgi:hypothetical protein
MGGIVAEIRTEPLPNMGLQRYRKERLVSPWEAREWFWIFEKKHVSSYLSFEELYLLRYNDV